MRSRGVTWLAVAESGGHNGGVAAHGGPRSLPQVSWFAVLLVRPGLANQGAAKKTAFCNVGVLFQALASRGGAGLRTPYLNVVETAGGLPHLSFHVLNVVEAAFGLLHPFLNVGEALEPAPLPECG